jgi:hypothetical protein
VPSSRRKHERRENFMLFDPFCWYCGTELVIPEGLGDNRPNICVIQSRLNAYESPTGKPQGCRNYPSCRECANEISSFASMIKTADSHEYWRKWRIQQGYPEDPNKINNERKAAAKLLKTQRRDERTEAIDCE